MKADEDANGKTVVARAYAKGPIGHNTTVTAGRIPLLDTYGMLLDMLLLFPAAYRYASNRTNVAALLPTHGPVHPK